MGAAAGGLGGSLRAPAPGESYLWCNGCAIAYVPAERDIATILSGLRVERRVAYQTRCYYGEGPTPTGLLTRHRTAIVRRVNIRRSILSVSVARDELIACFLYGGVRTFGSLVKRDDGPGGTSRYTLRWLGRA